MKKNIRKHLQLIVCFMYNYFTGGYIENLEHYFLHFQIQQTLNMIFY